MRRAALCAWLAIAGCATDTPKPEPVSTEDDGIGLSALPFAKLEIPDDSREGVEPPEAIPLRDWTLVRATTRGAVFRSELPVRSRALFFNKPAGDMHLRDGDGEVIHHARSARNATRKWTWDGETLDLYWDGSTAELEDIRLHYSRATERESALNFQFSDNESAEDFVRTEVQIGQHSRAGLLLPAPALAEWDLTIPSAGELRMHPLLVAPETLDGAPSDGAHLVVELDVDGKTEVLHRETLTVGPGRDVRVDLSPWAGERVRLRMRSEAGASSAFDYVFVGEPSVTPNRAKPRRVVLVFVDTLRPDHLGLYGYDRETSPALDALAKDAAVFESARSVAPWTLPSARAVVTGRQPEWYGVAPTLAEQFAAEGFATAMWAGNVYLSSNFEMTADWGLHHVENWPGAELQVDRALEWLDTQQGRDAFLLLHLMDPHLPYSEPDDYRYRWAGEAPEEFEGEFHLNAVRRTKITEVHEQFIVDRYDQNIRYADDQLARLYDTLGEDDILVFFSDHGEEFWEHGGFEHGHTLYDELLRVPLIIKGPNVPATRITEPVSLLDVAPTVLALAGIEPAGPVDGTDLGPVARSEEGARDALAARDLAFGRPLYGNTQWGVLHGDQKYTSKDGLEHLYDLESDPGEQRDLIRAGTTEGTEIHHERLGQALDTYAGPAYRLKLSATSKRVYEDGFIEVDVPGGVRAAFVKDDVAGFARLSAAVETIHEAGAEVDCDTAEICDGRVDRVTFTVHSGYRGATEAFIQPLAPMETVTPRLVMRGILGDRVSETTAADARLLRPGNTAATVARFKVGQRRVNLGYAIVPEPPEGARELKGHDSELDAMLQAMGYAVGEGAEEHTPESCGNGQDEDGDDKIDEGCE